MSLQHLTISFNLQPKERLTVFALRIGGFSPLFCCDAASLLIDRNMVSNAENILSEGGHRDNSANRWWHDFVNAPEYTLNPALAAFEGSARSIPSYEDFCHEFRRCCEILRRAFPRAMIIDYNEHAYLGAYALLGEITGAYDNEVKFLMKAAPLVAIPRAASKLQSFERELFSLAKESNLIRPTLSLLACLSCLYQDHLSGKRSPGSLVLKPKPNYTRKMANNAIMDLYGLALLIQGTAKLSPIIALCTSDKGLVQFWCALKVKSGGESTDQGFNFNLEYSDEMFPCLSSSEIVALKQRTEEYDFGEKEKNKGFRFI